MGQVVVAMMTSPGMGHLIPMLELAKTLTHHHHHLSATIIIPTSNPPSAAQTTVLRSLPASISYIFLPQVSLSDLPPDTPLMPLIAMTVLRSLPSLRHTLLSLSSHRDHRLAALIVDLLATDAIDIAADLNIPSYAFVPSSAMSLSLALMLPRLDQTVQCEFRDLAEPVQAPGCVPVHGKDLFAEVQDRNSEAYKSILNTANQLMSARGIIVNSFLQLEPGAIQELQKVYPVGPLVNMDRTAGDDECLIWLDMQPRGSVLFVSFGSGGTLSSAQINELALGLEMGEQRFLWVVRCPNDKIANGSYLKTIDGNNIDPHDFLPKGFVERTRGKGLLVPYWAPQAKVLAHESIGGFLTHCGWNSIIESIVNGVPLIAWPLFAEQKINAVLASEDLKVALRATVDENNGLVGREEIVSVVKRVMEGEEGKKLRHRVKDLKEAAAKALGKFGSSTEQIAKLVDMWTTQITI